LHALLIKRLRLLLVFLLRIIVPLKLPLTLKELCFTTVLEPMLSLNALVELETSLLNTTALLELSANVLMELTVVTQELKALALSLPLLKNHV